LTARGEGSLKRILLSFLLALSLASCGEEENDLGNGYIHVELDGKNSAIIDRDRHLVVDADVAEYEVYGQYIVGIREDANINSSLSQKYGYFVFDGKTRILREGLSTFEFQKALRENNLNTPRWFKVE